MIKNQLVDYITYTPHNFNKAVFNSIFNSYVNNINQFYQKSNLEKIDDYLYYIKYDDIDYSAGVDYSKRFKIPLGGCSSVYTNGLLGRNYDWYYDNSVTFVVRTSANESRHASIGAATIASLEKDFVEDGTWDDMYAVLPSVMLDGINDAGVMCNINVVPGGDRKNAFEIMQNGDVYLINVGDYDGTNPDEAISIQDIINSIINRLTTIELYLGEEQLI